MSNSIQGREPEVLRAAVELLAAVEQADAAGDHLARTVSHPDPSATRSM